MTVRIYEEPEFRDMLPWFIMIAMLFFVTGFVTFLTNPDQTVFAIAAVIAYPYHFSLIDLS